MVFDRARDGPGRIAVVTFVALFVLENAIGGMAIVRPADADLTALRSSWLIAHAGAHDTILSGNGPIFDWYLAYNTPATVVPTGFKNRDQLTADYATAIARQGDVFATDTVFAPPPEYLAQDPAGFAAALRFARAIRPAFVVAYRSETGVVYVRSNEP
jgi:hypothetical protein